MKVEPTYVQLQEENRRITEKWEKALAEVYAKSDTYPNDMKYQSVIGFLCDNYLDKSGALLGRVRQQAQEIHKRNRAKLLQAEIDKFTEELKELNK
jgi:hypothetical protein